MKIKFWDDCTGISAVVDTETAEMKTIVFRKPWLPVSRWPTHNLTEGQLEEILSLAGGREEVKCFAGQVARPGSIPALPQ